MHSCQDTDIDPSSLIINFYSYYSCLYCFPEPNVTELIQNNVLMNPVFNTY